MTSPANATATQAQQVLARHGRSFYWASQVLSAQQAANAARLYRCCRHLDDLADDSSDLVQAQQALSAAAASIVCGQTSDPVMADAIALLRQCGVPAAALLALIDGVSSDLEPVQMTDEASLIRYCYRVAGTVGLMMCSILETDHPAAQAYAIDLGIAMQLTNICRDVSADALLGRRYLPASMVGALAPEDLIDPSSALQPILRRCVSGLLQRADAYYQSGERGLAYLPPRARCAILVAARLYHAIGSELKRRNYAYWEGRVIVSASSKARISAQLLLTLPFRRSLWQRPNWHDANLHLALRGMQGAHH